MSQLELLKNIYGNPCSACPVYGTRVVKFDLGGVPCIKASVKWLRLPLANSRVLLKTSAVIAKPCPIYLANTL